MTAASVAISTLGSASGISAARMSSGSMVGRSPCTFTTTPRRCSGSSASRASKMRSEPETWSLRVMMARPPALSTAAATASESVATTASPMPASWARRSTCTIIGRPWISASGLPGRRVDARRAGMRMMASGMDTAGAGRTGQKVDTQRAYTGCQKGGKPVSVRRRRSLGGVPHRNASRPSREPYFDEFLRSQ